MRDHSSAPAPKPSRRRGFLRVLVAAYVVLLAISHVVRLGGGEREVPPQVELVDLRAVDRDRIVDRPVRLAYEDRGPPEGPPVILLHGSPGSRRDFQDVVGSLTPRYRAIVPDLPGFGLSERSVPDYSIRAHARYVLQLMDELGLESAHFVGFSMGGGVALNLYDLEPQRVRSLTLLSSIGVQELEMFGRHRINHAIHGAQLGALWLLHEAVPHMGFLDDVMLDTAYARNFFDTDQRPLRAILERFEPPALILHGDEDFLVLPEAAVEHHRIVPQSELQMIPGDHFMVFVAGESIGRRLLEFLDRVEAGSVPRRGSAEPQRLRRAAEPYDPGRLPPFSGPALLMVLALTVLATLISEDLTCIVAGLMIAQGRLEFLPAVLACLVGIYVGDILLFLAGRYLGRPALARAPFKWFVHPEQVEIASAWFRRRGMIVILLTRLLPGARLPTYFASGLLRTNAWLFSLFFLFAVALWTPLLVGFAMWLGDSALGAFEALRRHALLALALLGIWILVVVKLLLPLFTFRGRHRLRGRWLRLVRWEFWPRWAFYLPIGVYVLFLGIRHRHPLLFTAANPAIDAGGFISESKQAILDGLRGAGDLVARSRPIAAAQDLHARVEGVRAFMRQHELDFPVVLKPDTGQRGSGVAVVRDEAQVERYLQSARFDALVQEFAPGAEFGIFYYRRPGEPRGRIFSITEKRMPFVTGDGVRTLERLILTDSRAVCLLDHYFNTLGRRIAEVPAAGERVQLGEIGAHCMGTICLDGSRFMASELERTFDRISKSYEGFYFGRYDVRAPRPEALLEGRGFKIIELNGVTSEATHVYDPSIGLFRAYRTFFEQWRLAFEIGAANRARGARPAGWRHLGTLLSRYREASRTHPR